MFRPHPTPVLLLSASEYNHQTLEMNVFWRFGYEHTSLEILMRKMGIAKQSLYDTFGDKRALYLKALRQYRDNDHARLRRLFASGQPVKDGFARILFGISSESREEHERGRLLLSANMERDAKDRVIAEFLLDNQLKTEAIFTEALQRAQLEAGRAAAFVRQGRV